MLNTGARKSDEDARILVVNQNVPLDTMGQLGHTVCNPRDNKLPLGIASSAASDHPPAAISMERNTSLQRMYLNFMIGLHKGIRLRHIKADLGCTHVRCQLTEHLTVLRIDEGCDAVSEFPLSTVSRLCRGTTEKSVELHNALAVQEYMVVVHFKRRMFRFVFKTENVAICFMTCMEELASRAKAKPQKKLRVCTGEKSATEKVTSI